MAVLLVLTTLAGGCSSTPTRVPVPAAPGSESQATPGTPAWPAAGPATKGTSAPGSVTVLGAGGPVAPSQEKDTLVRVRAEGLQPLMDRQLRALTRHGDVNVHRGNRTRLLLDGPATFAAMKAAIDRAQDRVLLQSYIVDDDGVAAEVAALLVKKAAAGVKVALLFDAVGSIGTPKAFFEDLQKHGVAVCPFNPIDPTERAGVWNINHRDHRKLLVVDNEVGFTGGINISRVYGSAPGRGSGPGGSGGGAAPAGAPADEAGWRDTQVELRGPVVPALAELFAGTWRGQRCEGELGTPRRQAAEAGPRVVMVVASDPRDERNRIYDSLLEALRESQASVQLTMAYFAPGAEFVQALEDAARRGVAVELVLPGRSDSMLVLHAGRSYYARLLEAGVRIHELDHAVMHAKTAVVDGVFSTVGSTNLDWRSIVNNNELNVIVLGEDFGAEMTAMFRRDVAAAREVTLQAWRQRGIVQRVKEWIGRLAEPLL